MVSIQEELALATGMCSDILSIVEGYIWKPFKDIKINFVPTGQRRGHLIEETKHFDGSTITLEKIPISFSDLANSDIMSAAKRRRIIYYLIDLKSTQLPKTTKGFERMLYLEKYMFDILNEYPFGRGFNLVPSMCGKIRVSRTLLQAICDYIIKEIQKTQPIFRSHLN
tara:strand:+ start:262 stop:765 length:504 start_codon:yes stop_codon:yes gene_type:complete